MSDKIQQQAHACVETHTYMCMHTHTDNVINYDVPTEYGTRVQYLQEANSNRYDDYL